MSKGKSAAKGSDSSFFSRRLAVMNLALHILAPAP